MTNRIKEIFLLTFASVLFFSCGAQETKEMEGEKIYESVNLENFKKHLETENIQIIDVRTANEFSGGSVPNALNIDFYSKDFEEQINKLDKSKKTLIFCQGGVRSSKAMKKFKSQGFNHVVELNCGYGCWTN